MAATAATSLSHHLLAPKPKPRTPPRLSLLPRKPSRAAAAASDFLAPVPSLKSRLAAGDTLYGLFLLSFSPTLAEIAALAGYDYVVVDMEHGPGGIPEALACLRALDAARTPAVLRLPEACPVWAKKALDLGPAGLMLPAVESPAAAAEAVSYCRYPPRGVRGAAYPIVRAAAYGLDDSYVSRCEDDTLVICQVETAAGVAEVDAIAAVEGVDVVQMGPLDLSASMGYLWDPGNRKERAALREAEKKVLDARKKETSAAAYLGGFAMPNDPPEQLKLRGYHMVAGAVDIGLFRKAALEEGITPPVHAPQRDVKRFKEASMEIGEEEDGEELPAWFLTAYERRLRAFFWEGTETVHGGKCLVAWESVCRPVCYGGLGIPNLKLMGWALRLRWLWLRHSPERSWATLPSSPDPNLEGFFLASTKMVVGNGATARFWLDRWLDGRSVRDFAPHLVAAIDARTAQVRTVRQALIDDAWVRDITGALTVPVILEFLLLHNQLAAIPPLTDVEDRLTWLWTSDGTYTAASAYKALFLGLEFFACGKFLWKTWAPGKCKIHVWLFLHHRLWTADRRARHGLANHVTCPLCERAPETAEHIFLGCPFSRKIWLEVLGKCGLAALAPNSCLLPEWWSVTRKKLSKTRRKGFDSLVLLIFWKLWLERNARVFEGSPSTLPALCSSIANEAHLWKLAGATGLSAIWAA